MTIFWPSTHPSSRSFCRNASRRSGLSEGDVRLRRPIRGTSPACCASAASGAARRLTARTATSAIPLIIMSPPLGAASEGESEPVVSLRVLERVLSEALVRSEQDVLRHVRRVAAGQWLAAQGFGETPDVVRSRATADTEIADAQVERVPPELGDLVAVADERIERGRKRPVVRHALAVRV